MAVLLKIGACAALAAEAAQIGIADQTRELAPTQENEGRSLWWRSFKKCKRGRRIQADIDAPDSLHSDFHATVIGKEVAPGDDGAATRSVEWTVQLSGHDELKSAVNGHKCKELNWHIHTKPINPSASTPGDQCGPSVTSGHTDNGFACGGASEWGKTTCKYLYGDNDDTFKTVYSTKCGPAPCAANGSCTGCEYGDLSGKLGKIDVDDDGLQTFVDTHIEPIETYSTMSVVLHCCTDADGCGERIACGDIEYHRY